MAINPRSVNVTKNFVVSGVKYVGDYIYVLLIDSAQLCIIKRIKTDDSEIKFHLIEEVETIETLWENPESHSPYVWFPQL